MAAETYAQAFYAQELGLFAKAGLNVKLETQQNGPAIAAAAIPTVAGLAGGAAVARTHRQIVERAQLALEQILDRVEHGEARRPLSILDVLVR